MREHGRRFADAIDGNVRVDIAAPQEHRRAVERTRVNARRAWRTDQSPAETDHRRIAPRVARGELQRQARALGEAQDHDTVGGNALLAERLHEPADHAKRGA